MNKILHFITIFIIAGMLLFHHINTADAAFPASLQTFDTDRDGGLAVDVGWYEFGLPGVSHADKDMTKEEIKNIIKYANEGDAKNQFKLGTMYYAGQQIKQDYTAAFKWYRKAADQSNPLALNALGELYARGLGTKSDPDKALACFQAAAQQKIVTAIFNLGYIYSTGSYGQKTDIEKGISYYLQAADMGYPPAMLAMGRLQLNKRNMTEAYKWFCLADKYGNGTDFAKKDLADCALSINARQKDEAEKSAEAWKPQVSANYKKLPDLNGVWTYSFIPSKSLVYRFTIQLKEEKGFIKGHYKVETERFLQGITVLAEPDAAQIKNMEYGLNGKLQPDGSAVFKWYCYKYPSVTGNAVLEAGEGLTVLWTTETAAGDTAVHDAALPQLHKTVPMVRDKVKSIIDGTW